MSQSNPQFDETLDESQLQALNKQLPGWDISNQGLERCFEFANFRAAMAFMVHCSYFAEALNHHPNWENVYNRVKVRIFSHDRGAVTGRCVELARKMDSLVPSA